MSSHSANQATSTGLKSISAIADSAEPRLLSDSTHSPPIACPPDAEPAVALPNPREAATALDRCVDLEGDACDRGA